MAVSEIERSKDGKTNWEVIASSSSKGHSLQRRDYHTYDGKPLNGDNYYIKQIDHNNITLSEAQLVKFNFLRPVCKGFSQPGYR